MNWTPFSDIAKWLHASADEATVNDDTVNLPNELKQWRAITADILNFFSRIQLPIRSISIQFTIMMIEASVGIYLKNLNVENDA